MENPRSSRNTSRNGSHRVTQETRHSENWIPRGSAADNGLVGAIAGPGLLSWCVSCDIIVIRSHMAMLRVLGGCVSDRSSRAESRRAHVLPFDLPLHKALKNGYLPLPFVEMLVHIAQEGVCTVDLFRRPGNPTDIRHIINRLSKGKQVIYMNYSFYTLASVVKRFLLRLPGGVLTAEGEERLLQVLTIGHKKDQLQIVHNFIETLSKAHQQILTLLFGTWFRIVSNSEVNSMTVEALARSCAGSMFHTCAEDPGKVEQASRIMQLLIDNFGCPAMFGRDNIEYFTEITSTGILVREKFCYQYQYPSDEILPHVSDDIIEMTSTGGDSQREHEHAPSESPESSSPFPSHHPFPDMEESALGNTVSTVSAPEVSLMPSPEVSKRPKSVEDNLNEVKTFYHSRSLSRFNSVKRKQLERLRQRSDWFLGPNGKEVQVGCGDRELLSKKDSVTKASSEGAVLDVLSDVDSVFTDNSSRSESPASEPVRCHAGKGRRDFIHSDTLADLNVPELRLDFPELGDDDMTQTEVKCFLMEHKFGDAKKDS
ncbi:uncharacterized protein LOC124290662 isoform X3 [Haliotis rubra]|uniref:uncharacterized protein LOC124290662 isoform X3 n=1 Tax=Haliotis rubra TaxID=36100 RepID=UPI001EE61744|nr:uncharacterized protein LOC124290662 isoform X3 [Haliotis rubra]